ncbi:MAG: hypothetical protein FWH18_07095 [Marinilabiliaceae bacterium]|nr:hypothetical protein [Marinilabiliaceae bacterium]
MKKIVLMALLSLSFNTFCQNNPEEVRTKHNYSFGIKHLMGKSLNDFGADLFSVNAIYLYKFTQKFGAGAGIGIGYADAFRCYSFTSHLVAEDKKRDTDIMYSIFARGKYRFNTKPTSLYLLTDAGINSSSFQNWSGDDFYNSLGLFLSLQLGLNVEFNNKNSLNFSVGIQRQNIQYNDVKFRYSSVFNSLIFDSSSIEKDYFDGLCFGIEYSF